MGRPPCLGELLGSSCSGTPCPGIAGGAAGASLWQVGASGALEARACVTLCFDRSGR